MLQRGGEATKWAWDDVPVRSMRAAKWMPTWWTTHASDLHTADLSTAYADEHALQEEERDAIHKCALLYHQRRLQTVREAIRRSNGRSMTEDKQASSCGIMTPPFHGRTPGTGFMMQHYLSATEETHKLAQSPHFARIANNAPNQKHRR